MQMLTQKWIVAWYTAKQFVATEVVSKKTKNKQYLLQSITLDMTACNCCPLVSTGTKLQKTRIKSAHDKNY